MVTRGKRWSNSAGSGWPQGLKSGGPSLGRSPGAHKQRRPVNQNQIQILGEIGSTQLLEQGTSLALFFKMLAFEAPVFWKLVGCSAASIADSVIAVGHDGTDPSDPAQFRIGRRA